MAEFSIPGYTVVLAAYQWEYLAGRSFGGRNENTTDYGVLHRGLTGTVQRTMKLRLTQPDADIEALRTLSMRAGRRALPVTFTDEDGVAWTVNWPSQVAFTQILDNRREIELDLLEQSTG